MARPLAELYESQLSEAQGNVAQALKSTAVMTGKLLEKGVAKPEDVNIRDCFEVFVQPLLKEAGKSFDPMYGDYDEIREEVVSSQFPYATNKLISPTMTSQYELDVADIMPLVSETTSNHPDETVAGTTAGDSPRYTEEAMPYPESGLGEKRVSIKNFKFGHTLSLTTEMVRFDQTGELLKRARNVGSRTADVVEEFICNRITDTAWSEIHEATSQAFVQDGTRRALYSSDHSAWDVQTNDNLVQSGTGGVPSITQVKSMVNLLKGQKDIKGKPVRVRPQIVFGHAQLEEDFDQFFTAQEFDIDSGERNKNRYRGKYKIITSQFAPDSTEWFMGDFARQFRLQWVWKPKVTVDRTGDPRRDILVSYYSNFYAGVGAEDHRFVARNAGA